MYKILIGMSVVIVLLTSGCSSKSEPVVTKKPVKKPKIICNKKCTKKIYLKAPKAPKKVTIKDREPQYLKYRTISHTRATSINTDTIEQIVVKLSNQLEKNNQVKNLKNSNLSISPFVYLNKTKDNSRFPKVLHDSLVHEMQKRAYKIFNNKKNISMKGIDFILIGDYVKLNKGMLINAKIVNAKTNIIISTAQILIPSRELKRL
jgi:TolB-like protein